MIAFNATHVQSCKRWLKPRMPSIVILCLLAALGWWGHRHHWMISPSLAHTETNKEKVQWCEEHGVEEAICILCKKELFKEAVKKEPAASLTPGVKPRFAPVSGDDVLKRAGIMWSEAQTTAITPTVVISAETKWDPTRTTRHTSRLSGQVITMCVQLGDHVVPGENLLVLEAVEVGAIKSTLLRALADARAIDSAIARINAGIIGGYRTGVELAEAKVRAQAARMAIIDAEQGLMNFGLPVNASLLDTLSPSDAAAYLRHLGLSATLLAESLSTNLLPISSTRSGVVTAVSVASGDTVTEGSPLITITDADALSLVIHASPSEVTKLKVGQSVQFTPARDAHQSVAGTIQSIGDALDETTRLIPVRALLNKNERLRAGHYGMAEIIIGEAQAAVHVPRTAVIFEGEQAYIFVRRSETLYRCLPVTIFSQSPTHYNVHGLAAGTTYVAMGADILKSRAFVDKMGAGCCAK